MKIFRRLGIRGSPREAFVNASIEEIFHILQQPAIPPTRAFICFRTYVKAQLRSHQLSRLALCRKILHGEMEFPWQAPSRVSTVLFLQEEKRGCVPTEQAVVSVQGALTGFIRVQEQSYLKLLSSDCILDPHLPKNCTIKFSLSSCCCPGSKIQQVIEIYIV